MTKYNFNLLSIFILFMGGFFLFDLSLFASYAMGLQDKISKINIGYRGVFLIFSVIMIVRNFRPAIINKNRLLIFLFLGFWALYLMRVFYHSFIMQLPAIHSGEGYLVRSIGMAIIPSLAFLFVDLSQLKKPIVLKSIILVLGLLTLIAVFYIWQFGGESIRRLRYIGYMRGEILGPHTVSYLGASVFSTLVAMLVFNKLPKAWLFIVFLVAGLSLFPLVQGGSRGALVAAGVTITFLLGLGRFPLFKKIAFSVPIFTAIAFAFVYFNEYTSVRFLVRRFDLLIENMQYNPYAAGAGRVPIYLDTISQIMHSPVIGDSLVVESVNHYPHNHILEAFLTTGVMGGLLFLILLMISLHRSFQIIRNFPEYSFLVSFFLFSFIAGMLSFSILDPKLWYSIFIVWALSSRLPLERSNQASRQMVTSRRPYL